MRYYSSLDLSDKKNLEEVADFKDDIYLFKEKFIITRLQKYKVWAECGKDAYGMVISINPKRLENFDIVLPKAKNGYKLCNITKFGLLYGNISLGNILFPRMFPNNDQDFNVFPRMILD